MLPVYLFSVCVHARGAERRHLEGLHPPMLIPSRSADVTELPFQSGSDVAAICDRTPISTRSRNCSSNTQFLNLVCNATAIFGRSYEFNLSRPQMTCLHYQPNYFTLALIDHPCQLFSRQPSPVVHLLH